MKCGACHDDIDVQHEVSVAYGDKNYHNDCIKVEMILTPRHVHRTSIGGYRHAHVNGLARHFHKEAVPL